MDRKITKEHGYRMSLSVLIGYLPLIPVFWFIVKPVLINAVSDAVAEDIQSQVKGEVGPINNAFVALLQRDINKIKREIAALEHKHEDSSQEWTELDARILADQEVDLAALTEALSALKDQT